MEQLGALCRMKPTRADCAAFFQCSEDTIERRIKEETGLKFAEFRERHFVKTIYDLQREALKRAKKSDTILIFALKNFCNWSDKQSENNIQVNVNSDNAAILKGIPREKLIEMARKAKEEKAAAIDAEILDEE